MYVFVRNDGKGYKDLGLLTCLWKILTFDWVCLDDGNLICPGFYRVSKFSSGDAIHLGQGSGLNYFFCEAGFNREFVVVSAP